MCNKLAIWPWHTDTLKDTWEKGKRMFAFFHTLYFWNKVLSHLTWSRHMVWNTVEKIFSKFNVALPGLYYYKMGCCSCKLQLHALHSQSLIVTWQPLSNLITQHSEITGPSHFNQCQMPGHLLKLQYQFKKSLVTVWLKTRENLWKVFADVFRSRCNWLVLITL